MAKQQRLAIVAIEEFSKEGQGRGVLAEQEGRLHSVDVPFSKPGDIVQVRLLKKEKGVFQAQPLEWMHFAHDRVVPRCIHFGKCGGCRWQHIDYKDQLKQKEEGIRRSLNSFIRTHTVWHPIIPCAPPWHYRNKMELSFSTTKSGEHRLGMTVYGTRGQVFQMEECHLMFDWGICAVQAVTQWWLNSGLEAYYGPKDKGSLRTLTLRTGQRTGDRMVILTVSGNPSYALNQKHIQDFVYAIREAIEPASNDQKLSIFLKIQQIAKGQRTQFYEMLIYGADHIREALHIDAGNHESQVLNFRISPSAFFQPNSRQAEQLYSRAIQLTGAPQGGVVYDLYCGTGTLGICMAKKAKQVIGIELSPESALDARENVKFNHLDNISIHTGDVGKVLPTLLQDPQLHPEIVMVDPPRAGLDARALKHLLTLKPPVITYLSCNPATQALNLELLIQEGYRLLAVQPVDQFPHTPHVENIAVLAL